MSSVKYCHAKTGGTGYVPASECACTPRKKCQALKDREEFLEVYQSMETTYSRKQILDILDGQFADSDWYKDNVVH